MSTRSPNPILSSEEVQRIIDERLEVILGKEAAALQNTDASRPSRKKCTHRAFPQLKCFVIPGFDRDI